MSDSLHCTSKQPELLEARAHEKRAESEMLFAQAKRAKAERQLIVPQLEASALTSSEACAALKISKATLSRLVADGLPVTFAGTRRRFNLTDVQRWLNQRGSKAAPKPMRQHSTEPAESEGEMCDRDLKKMGLRRP